MISRIKNLVTMREINDIKHVNSNYVLTQLYLKGEINEKLFIIKIFKDAHLIKNLDIKILIKINILRFKKVIFNLLTKQLCLINNILCSLIIKSLRRR